MTTQYRELDPDNDFALLARLFTTEMQDPTTEEGLREDYEKHKERILCLRIATSEQGDVQGFNWLKRDRNEEQRAYFYVVVSPEHRHLGIGSWLYQEVEAVSLASAIRELRASFPDTLPESRAFADKRGFTPISHSIGMQLELEGIDLQPYLDLATELERQGFEFTTMEALGNTEADQHKLYQLNDITSSQTMGSEGEHSWSSFEDFQQTVCQSDWYNPAGQMIVIEKCTGKWVAMSAIARFEGQEEAYNLFTGVDEAYRGRKLAQAVKAKALLFAREVLGVKVVRTNHNALNEPMIAIDRKFGYVQSPGLFYMRKHLVE
ncbi:MAG TPA: GNAT family N-acetyltransferase [Anaerolineaceae bacterium]|nr:GNAT family N-acetyltransferase [Anaerolineaceae bacterium]